MRPEVSKRSKYYVEKHRYYELKHFCLQYPIWKQEYMNLDGFGKAADTASIFHRTDTPSDPTSRFAEKRLFYFENMRLVENTAIEADNELSSYILKGVTEGLSYVTLKASLGIPCSKDMYYDRYRRFFWLLDRSRF